MILVTKKELEEELVIHFWDMQKQKTNTRINILRQRFVISYILRYKIMYMDWQWLKKIKKNNVYEWALSQKAPVDR